MSIRDILIHKIKRKMAAVGCIPLVKSRRIRMKKALVLILILAVAGGVFAAGIGQASAKDGEGGWSGSATVDLRSEINLIPVKPTIGWHNDSVFSGGVSYTEGGFNFGLEAYWNKDDGSNVDIDASYATDRFGLTFGAGVYNTTETVTITIEAGDIDGTDPATDLVYTDTVSSASIGVYAAYGYYKFMDGNLTLKAAWAGGGESLWRTSTVVLRPRNFNGSGLGEHGNWENQGGSLYLYFTGMEGLNIGVRLPSPFVGSKTLEKYIWGTVIGAKYSAGDIAFSTMFALGSNRFAEGMSAHVGFTMKVSDMINFGLDGSFFDLGSKYLLGVYSGPAINIGTQVNFAMDALTARLTARAFNLTKSNALAVDVLVTVGYKVSDTFSFGIDINSYNLLDKPQARYMDDVATTGRQLRVKPSLTLQATEAVKVTASVEYNKGLGTVNKVHTLSFNPSIAWTVYKNATITFWYNLGYNMVASAVTANNFRVGFKWTY
jgi:hypothetical protein